jgi:hypothetical protein
MADFDAVQYDLKRLLRSIREGKPLRPFREESIQDSDIMASFIGNAFASQGYKIRFKFVRELQFDQFHHVFVEVLDPLTHEWIPIDPQRTEPVDWAEEKTVEP